MGCQKPKIEKPNANVVNNVEIIDHTTQLDELWYLLLINTVVSAASLLIKTYLLHETSPRKRYISRANESDKIYDELNLVHRPIQMIFVETSRMEYDIVIWTGTL